MTTNPSDEPAAGATPPPASGQQPPAYGQQPPAYGQQPGYGQAPYGQQGYTPTAGVPLSDSDQRLWATLSHVGGILFGFIAPLVIWLVFKDRGRFVDEQGKEALNFQILVAIVYVIGAVTTVIGIGILIMFVAWIVSLIFAIMAAVATNRGEPYRYPINWRIVK